MRVLKRVLIVGHGNIGKRHLRLVRESLPKTDIRVLRHRPGDDLLDYANGCFNELEDACNFRPEASIVANPAPFHVDTAISLMEAGSHVLVEKPIAERVESAHNLLTAAYSYKRILHVGYNLRFVDSLCEFRNLVHSCVLGKICSVHCEVGQFLPSWRPGTDYRLGVSANKHLGGGVLLELSHELDYLRWIFGEIEWVSACIAKQSSLEIDVEDSAYLILGFAQDSTGYRLLSTVNLDFIRHDKTRVCTAIGEKGSLRWNGVRGSVEKWEKGQDKWVKIYQSMDERDDSYRFQWKHFIDCINTKTVPMVKGEDAMAILRVIEAAHESASRSGIRLVVSNYRESLT